MKSIQAKIILLLLCCLLIVSFGVAGACIAQTSSILHDSAEENMTLLCEKNAQELNTLLLQVQESVDTLSQHVVGNLDSIGVLRSPDTLASYIASIEEIGINHASGIKNACSVYVLLAPEQAGNSQGFFWLRDEKSGLLAKNEVVDLSNYTEADVEYTGYYTLAKKNGLPTWVDAYYNRNVGMRMFSYVVPLYKNDVFFGVVGMDIACSTVEAIARKVSIFETGYAAVLNSNQTVMYHPTIAPDIKVNHLESFQSAEDYNSIRDSMTKNNTSAQLFTYELEGEARMFAFYRLHNGMYLCVAAPTAEIYQKQTAMVTVSAITAAAILSLCLIAAVLFARRLTKPIKALNNAAYQMIKGNLEEPIQANTKDEIGKLAFSINKAREQLKLHIDSLHEEALTDGLTGVSNKSAFVEQERLLNKRIKEGKASFVVALFDVNRLKITNDLFGHMAGDEMLRIVATHLREHFDQKNVFRIGGDEFVLLVQGNNTRRIAERIATVTCEMQKLQLSSYEGVTISCSVGIAIFDPKTDQTLANTLARADKLMYKNKAYTKKNAPAWQEGSKGLRQLQLEKYLEFLQILAQSTQDYLFLLDIENDKNYFLGNIGERYAIPAPGRETNTIAELLSITHEGDRAALSADLKRVLNGESNEHNMDYRWIDRDGNTVWINCRGRVIRDESGNPFLMIGRVSDTLLISSYNPVTALLNKQRLSEDLQNGKAPPFSHFMLLDVDNLTDINLNKGRATGDDLLRKLAGILESIFQMRRVYHVEKDRFAILLDQGAEKKVRTHFERINKLLVPGATVSAAVVPNDGTLYLDENSLYEYAKHLLKEGKSISSRKLSFFSERDYLQKIADIALLEEIEDSVRNHCKGFRLLYQPQVRAGDYAVIGAEALLRYDSPSKGAIEPERFIPILERTKLIDTVGLWVCATALKQCSAWRAQAKDFSVSVNFSLVQLRNPHIASRVIKLLQEYGLPGSALTIELTESIPIEDSDQLTEAFNKFRRADVRISIDDFGTGYANFAHLKKIHADEVKIDRIFTQGIRSNSYNLNIVRNMVDIAKGNNLRVCFEGVETIEDLLGLEQLGGNFFQGFLFGKASPAVEFEQTFLPTSGSVTWDFLKDVHLQRGRSQLRHMDAKDILAQVGIGIWLMRYDKKADDGELWVDSTLHNLLGIPTDLSPAQSFDYWRNSLTEEIKQKLRDLVREMQVSGKVFQFEIPWTHPERGLLVVRYTGKCVERDGDSFLLEGFHRIIRGENA